MKRLQKNKYTSGLTLLELIIVMGILSALTVFVISVINPIDQIRKASDARKKGDLAQMQRALEAYYQDLGAYPPMAGVQDYRITDLSGQPVEWGSPFPPYMTILPRDSTNNRYVYYSSGDGQSYWIYASLERSGDPDSCGAICPSVQANGIADNACIEFCNYAVSSPNVSR